MVAEPAEAGDTLFPPAPDPLPGVYTLRARSQAAAVPVVVKRRRRVDGGAGAETLSGTAAGAQARGPRVFVLRPPGAASTAPLAPDTNPPAGSEPVLAAPARRRRRALHDPARRPGAVVVVQQAPVTLPPTNEFLLPPEAQAAYREVCEALGQLRALAEQAQRASRFRL